MRSFHVGCLAVSVALGTSPANAQTLFAWPDTSVDVASYTTIEECQAAVSRTAVYTDSRAELASGVWLDTIPLDSTEARSEESLRPSVRQTAQRCGARFANPDSVSLTHFAAFITLYLQAGWDVKARALAERRLAGIGPKDDVQRAAVLDSLLRLLHPGGGPPIGPTRYEMARELVREHLPKVSDRLKRLNTYSNMSRFISAAHNPDSAMAQVMEFAEEMGGIVDSLTEREMDVLLNKYGALADGIDEPSDFVQRYYAMLNLSLGQRTFLDSLRRSTDAYVKLKRGNWALATGMRPETYGLGNPLGEHAPPIEADIWLGHDPATGPRPAPGRVSLIVFLNSHECNGVVTSASLYGNCARHLRPLSRLEARFPDLEITVVAQSYGYFLYLKEGITPRKEAELTKQWLEAHGVHAALAMTTTNSWRLPDPDGRQVSRPTANRTNYSFGRSWKAGNSAAFLVDQSGIVVHSRQMNRWSVFDDYNELVEILLERRVAEFTQ